MSTTLLKAVLFDLDGIIVDSEPIYDELCRHHLREAGVQFNKYEDLLGGTWEVIFEYINQHFGTNLDPIHEADAMAHRIVDYIQQRGIPLKVGVRDFIIACAERYDLAVVSSSHRIVVEQMLRHHRLEDYFKTLVTYQDITYPKPHPQPYEIAMERLNVTSEQSIVIEDSVNGVKSGAAAGVFVYALPDSRLSVVDIQSLAQIVYSFEDIARDIL